MKGYKSFTSDQAKQICNLLDKKIGLASDEQLQIRNEIRDGFVFYISDFQHDLADCPTYEAWRGMTSSDFRWLVDKGVISVKGT